MLAEYRSVDLLELLERIAELEAERTPNPDGNAPAP
jgi:hypothetical protein